MGRSSLFDRFARTVRVANFCNRRQIATREGMEIYDSRQQQQSLSRREFLANAGRLAAVAAGRPIQRAQRSTERSSPIIPAARAALV